MKIPQFGSNEWFREANSGLSESKFFHEALTWWSQPAKEGKDERRTDASRRPSLLQLPPKAKAAIKRPNATTAYHAFYNPPHASPDSTGAIHGHSRARVDSLSRPRRITAAQKQAAGVGAFPAIQQAADAATDAQVRAAVASMCIGADSAAVTWIVIADLGRGHDDGSMPGNAISNTSPS